MIVSRVDRENLNPLVYVMEELERGLTAVRELERREIGIQVRAGERFCRKDRQTFGDHDPVLPLLCCVPDTSRHNYARVACTSTCTRD